MATENKETIRVDAFIERWKGREGGQERANYALFLTEMCAALGLTPPDPASANTEDNDYVFERAVKEQNLDGSTASRRMDLYKRGCFVLEAKQSRLKGGTKEIVVQSDLFGSQPLPSDDRTTRGRRSAKASWDVYMLNARRQAEGYARALPVDHGWPPFILVCDVGHVIEVYADFSGQGKNYAQFPDRQSFRIYLEDLHQPEIRTRLSHIWKDPSSLDPARHAARVTRAIAERLADVSKALEKQKHPPEDVALFLMRCLFTMFAEDVGLLPAKSFRQILERCEKDTSKFQPIVSQLWEAMDKGEFAHVLETRVKKFNGEFFKSRGVIPLQREEIGELRRAASYDWRDVDPSIFGTLLEQALDEKERRRLGAHYTPRVYVERLVVATVIEPLRQDWGQSLATAERQKAEGRAKDAVATVQAFHDKLCQTRILDPACGSGNFLYVSLELVKRLEGEVLEALSNLGGQEVLRSLEGHTVDPHQFMGLEINPRAVAIAELVLWIGHLQWHIRTKGGLPSEPILRAFKNITAKDAVLQAQIVRATDKAAYPPTHSIRLDVRSLPLEYKNAKRPEWPTCEFIVGNPPFLGKGEPMRSAFGQPYLDGLKVAHPNMEESADFVLYWWDYAADLLTRRGAALRRFGFVTTNSITQIFNRRVVERHLAAKKPISLVFAIPDHPWTKATSDAAAVRIAMTVGQAGKHQGVLSQVVREAHLDSDEPIVTLDSTVGEINADLTVGVDVTAATPLKANDGLASMGPALGGRGFVLLRAEAHQLSPERTNASWLKKLTTGKDITGHHRQRMVIDVRNYETEAALRKALPQVYQRLKDTVYPERKKNNDPKLREFWWRFRRSNEVYFNATHGLRRFIATVETTKHRVFIFVGADELLEHGVIGFGSDDAYTLGVLSSRQHICWVLANGGTLEDRPRYNKDVCFDTFPFPEANQAKQDAIRGVAEELDGHRRDVLDRHSKLTLTGLYNVLDKLRAGVEPKELTLDDRKVYDDGLLLVLRELHERLDAAVAEAYGWPDDLSAHELVERLATLNQQRAADEARGLVQWLRPAYQVPRFGSAADRPRLELAGGGLSAETVPAGKPVFPADDLEQTAAVLTILAGSSAAVDPVSLARSFKQGRRCEPKVRAVLLSLVRMGYVAASDSGESFMLRRVA